MTRLTESHLVAQVALHIGTGGRLEGGGCMGAWPRHRLRLLGQLQALLSVPPARLPKCPAWLPDQASCWSRCRAGTRRQPRWTRAAAWLALMLTQPGLMTTVAHCQPGAPAALYLALQQAAAGILTLQPRLVHLPSRWRPVQLLWARTLNLHQGVRCADRLHCHSVWALKEFSLLPLPAHPLQQAVLPCPVPLLLPVTPAGEGLAGF